MPKKWTGSEGRKMPPEPFLLSGAILPFTEDRNNPFTHFSGHISLEIWLLVETEVHKIYGSKGCDYP